MIDVKRFCGADDPREYLNAPFQEGGKTFATNGHIAIQLDGPADPSTPEVNDIMKGRIQKLLDEAAGNSIELVINLPPAQQCEHCAGSGRINVQTCEECHGSGSFEHGSHTYGCKECAENGEIHTPATPQASGAEVCICCDGHGTTSSYIDLQAAEITHRFQEKYLRLIRDLPGSRLYAGKTNSDAARFEFEGGRGVVNPCRI